MNAVSEYRKTFPTKQDVIEQTALTAVSRTLEGKQVRKVIVVKGRLVNIVA